MGLSLPLDHNLQQASLCHLSLFPGPRAEMGKEKFFSKCRLDGQLDCKRPEGRKEMFSLWYSPQFPEQREPQEMAAGLLHVVRPASLRVDLCTTKTKSQLAVLPRFTETPLTSRILFPEALPHPTCFLSASGEAGLIAHHHLYLTHRHAHRQACTHARLPWHPSSLSSPLEKCSPNWGVCAPRSCPIWSSGT